MNVNFPKWTASELIVALETMKKKHGDRPVYHGGGDYPEPAGGIYVQKNGDGYIPKGAFVIT